MLSLKPRTLYWQNMLFPNFVQYFASGAALQDLQVDSRDCKQTVGTGAQPGLAMHSSAFISIPALTVVTSVEPCVDRALWSVTLSLSLPYGSPITYTTVAECLGGTLLSAPDTRILCAKSNIRHSEA